MTPNKILVWSALCSILLLSTPAAAQYGESTDIHPYVSFTMGLALTPDLDSSSFDPAPVSLFTDEGPNLTVGGGVGAVSGYTRHELRVDYHRAKVSGVTNVVGIYDRPCNVSTVDPPCGASFEGVAVTMVDPAGETISVTTLLYTIALRQAFLDDKLAVYGGIGIGAAYGIIPIGGVTIKDWQFGYSFGTGVFYDIWQGIGLDFGYRYVAATDFSGPVYSPVDTLEFGDGEFPFLVSWSAHELVLSLRYSWGGTD